MKQPADSLHWTQEGLKQFRTELYSNVLQENCEWRWTPCRTTTLSPQTAARPRATPALPAPLAPHTVATPPLTGPETFTDVRFLSRLQK